MSYTKGQLTTMAKKICKVNDALHNAIGWCEEISHDKEICYFLKNKDEHKEEYNLLVERIEKYSNRLDCADGNNFGRDIDDATELLSLAYEDIE